MIIKSDNIVNNVVESADVCIVGSGPAGSVMAMEMAEGGLSVIVLEEGGHFSGSRLNMREEDMLPALYNQRFTKDLSIALSQGKCLGGGSLINMADSVRTPDGVFAVWEKKFGVKDISPGAMKKYFDRAETILKTKKIEEAELNSNNLVLKKGVEKAGYTGDAFYHNREGCIECGYCLLGCPYGHKQATTENYIPRAIESGAKFYVNARADKILVDGERAEKVVGTILDGKTGMDKVSIEVNAKVIVMAAGTINTPQLLLKSKIPDESGLIGKNLILQPYTMVFGLFDEELKSYKGIPQSYYTDNYEEVDEDRGLTGFRLEGGFTLPGQVSTVVPGFGEGYKELMTKYSRMANIMALVFDGPDGTVSLNRFGRPVIEYEMTDQTKADMVRAMKESANLLFTAGAKKVMFTYEIPAVISDPSEISIVDERGIEPCSLTIMSFHIQGTCRMGPDPASSVVDSSLECHGAKNLFVVDGSVSPTTSSSHNMLPTMALSHRTADYILTNRGRYFG